MNTRKIVRLFLLYLVGLFSGLGLMMGLVLTYFFVTDSPAPKEKNYAERMESFYALSPAKQQQVKLFYAHAEEQIRAKDFDEALRTLGFIKDILPDGYKYSHYLERVAYYEDKKQKQFESDKLQGLLKEDP